MAYKAVIFDLDGTLVRSLPEHRYNVVGATPKELGESAFKQEIDMFWYETERNKIVEERFGVSNDDFWPIYRKYDKTEIRKKFTKPYSDIEILKELKKKEIKLGIVTGAPLHLANLEVGMIGEELFDTIVIAHIHNGITPKPDPQGLNECLNLLGINKSGAIYVSNGNEDVLTARKAGVFDVLIDRKEYTFPKTNPSLTIKSLFELKKFLKID